MTLLFTAAINCSFLDQARSDSICIWDKSSVFSGYGDILVLSDSKFTTKLHNKFVQGVAANGVPISLDVTHDTTVVINDGRKHKNIIRPIYNARMLTDELDTDYNTRMASKHLANLRFFDSQMLPGEFCDILYLDTVKIFDITGDTEYLCETLYSCKPGFQVPNTQPKIQELQSDHAAVCLDNKLHHYRESKLGNRTRIRPGSRVSAQCIVNSNIPRVMNVIASDPCANSSNDFSRCVGLWTFKTERDNNYYSHCEFGGQDTLNSHDNFIPTNTMGFNGQQSGPSYTFENFGQETQGFGHYQSTQYDQTVHYNGQPQPNNPQMIGVPNNSQMIGVPNNSQMIGVPNDSQMIGVPNNSQMIGVPNDSNQVNYQPNFNSTFSQNPQYSDSLQQTSTVCTQQQHEYSYSGINTLQ